MNTQLPKNVLGVAIALTLTACGGGGGVGGGGISGIGGSGFISSGSVTGFGSVFVNGVEFETDKAEIKIEGISGTQTDLVEGMRVKVSGKVNADGITGTATAVAFEDQLEGPVSIVFAPTEVSDLEDRTIIVLGVSVNLNSVDTMFVGTINFDNIVAGDNIQISGFFDDKGVLQATAVVEKNTFVASTTIVEVKGTISGLSSNNFTLTIGSATLTVDASGADISQVTGGLAESQFVEVKGTITAVDGTPISATLIKLNENNPTEGAEVEVEGIISDFNPATNTFKIDDITVDASSTTLIKTPSTLTLNDGIKVEAEGSMSNGLLQANILKLREGNARVHAPARLDTNTANTLFMTVSGNEVRITIDTSTRLDDKLDAETFSAAVNKLDNQFLQVRGINNGDGILATRIRIKNPDDDVILQGVVSAKDPGNNSVTVFGITVEVDGTTGFQNIDNTPFTGTPSVFFNGLTEGVTLIKIKDKDLTNNGISDTDGIADNVELQLP